MSFHIVADSCCELTADMKKRGNIEIAPLTLEVGGESILVTKHLIRSHS